PAFQPYWGKPAVRNDREGRGNVGIIRSPVRASILPDYIRSDSVIRRRRFNVRFAGKRTRLSDLRVRPLISATAPPLRSVARPRPRRPAESEPLAASRRSPTPATVSIAVAGVSPRRGRSSALARSIDLDQPKKRGRGADQFSGASHKIAARCKSRFSLRRIRTARRRLVPRGRFALNRPRPDFNPERPIAYARRSPPTSRNRTGVSPRPVKARRARRTPRRGRGRDALRLRRRRRGRDRPAPRPLGTGSENAAKRREYAIARAFGFDLPFKRRAR